MRVVYILCLSSMLYLIVSHDTSQTPDKENKNGILNGRRQSVRVIIGVHNERSLYHLRSKYFNYSS